MKIKLDENLPDRFVQALADLGHDVDTVVHERLAGKNDFAVWTAAQQAGRFLITQDLDFLGYPSLRARHPPRLATFAHAGSPEEWPYSFESCPCSPRRTSRRGAGVS